MTDGPPADDSGQDERRTIRIPDRGGDRAGDIDEGLVKPADLGSASRSCLAIIVVLIIIVLLVCVFVAVQTLS